MSAMVKSIEYENRIKHRTIVFETILILALQKLKTINKLIKKCKLLFFQYCYVSFWWNTDFCYQYVFPNDANVYLIQIDTLFFAFCDKKITICLPHIL